MTRKSWILSLIVVTGLQGSISRASTVDPVAALRSATRGRTLGCRILESGPYRPAPPFVELDVQPDPQTGQQAIMVTAHYAGGDYQVLGAAIQDGSLAIDLMNSMDGPHSQDRLELPLASLQALADEPTLTLHGHDQYSEDLDGTTTGLPMSCQLE